MARRFKNTNLRPTIIAAAARLAQRRGINGLTRQLIACAAGVGESTVSFHFGKMEAMEKAIVEHAVANRIIPILAQIRTLGRDYKVPMDDKLIEEIGAFIAK